MSFLLRRLGLALGLTVLVAPTGCSTGASDAKTSHALPPGMDPVTGSVRFDEGGTLELALGVPAVLHVTASPPKAYTIGFTLVGGSIDASLDASAVVTDAAGQASVTMLAPSQATTFHVRATLLADDGSAVDGSAVDEANGAVGLPTAELVVAVSDEGFGTVRVSPEYAGQRTITTWTANVVAKDTCKDLAPTLPADPAGALTGTAPEGGDPVIGHVPVGADLAVTLRAGHFAWGCAPAPTLTADATVDVPVMVFDKPLDLTAANLAATFTYSADPTAYPAFLADAVSALDDAFMPAGTGEGSIVLNAMAASAGEPGDFAEQRLDQGWDAIADQHFAALPQGLRDTCAAWATAGVALQPTSFTANVIAGAQPGQALVAVTQLGALAPAAVGAAGGSSCTWSAQPGDVVVVSGGLTFEPSRFAGASCLTPALAAEPGAATVSDALVLAADCGGLATALGPFGTCDVDCMAALCGTAITLRWKTALGASAEAAALAQVGFEASANATIDDDATPVSLFGHWLGTAADATVTAAVKGNVTASQTAPVPFNPP